MKKFINKTSTLQLAIFATLFIGLQFYEFVELYTPITFFYEKMVSLAWFLVGIYFVLNHDSIIARIFIMSAFNNFLDELFFNPLVYGWNEKMLTLVVVFLLYHKYNKNATQVHRNNR